ncbi:MAG: FecR domain-containing protein [Deltaproteobacteria bacterium]
MRDFRGVQRLEAVQKVLAFRTPALDHARVRRRVLEAYAAGRRPSHRLKTYQLALLGLSVLAMAAAIVLVLSWRAPTTFEIAGHVGQTGSWLEAQPSEPLVLRFSEGSVLSLGASSRGRVSRVSREGTRIELERGSVEADVVHRSGTDWSFGAGPFEVAVLGTQLHVSWKPEAGQFELRVSRGAVRVRGPLIQGSQDVHSGQSYRVDLDQQVAGFRQATPATDIERQPSEAPRAPAPRSSAPSAPSHAVRRAASTGPARVSGAVLARAGKPRDAVAAAERAGLEDIYASASAESLLDLARAARGAGRADVERSALLACRKRAPGQATAAQAAYLLGRASPPSEAVTWFETYLNEQPSGLLAREASGRRLESSLATADRSGAMRAAAHYLAAYPEGPHASMARRTLRSGKRKE